MIRIRDIRIEEFRGIRELSLNFNSKTFAVCGPNGTGKSGIVDALEFGLTGNISRLSGKGMGGMSLKEHAPHVDSRNRPDKAKVTLTVEIPQLGKTATITRSVKDADKPVITPNDPAVLEVLLRAASHPEFALSRRELIRYVISTPGDRAKEVQILLRLDQIDQLRVILQKISNAATKDVAPLEQAKNQARDNFLRALDIPQLALDKILVAVNARRTTLGLAVLESLPQTISFRDGFSTVVAPASTGAVPKAQALADVKLLNESLARLGGEDLRRQCADAAEKILALSADPAVLDSVTREQFLQSALTLFDDEHCPVCDTVWEPDELRNLIGAKLKHFDEVKRKRTEIEADLEPLLIQLRELRTAVVVVEQHGIQLKVISEECDLEKCKVAIDENGKQIRAFLPLPQTIKSLQSLMNVEPNARAEIDAIEAAITVLPEPTDRDAAQVYLTIAQERREALRTITLQVKQAEDHAALSRRIYDTYAKVSTAALDEIYKEVETDFSELYRLINEDDEATFTAQLTPSIGKLGFDVDFYGRGKFPPGAYHSEGHQDGMGLCLYLALMKHTLRDNFTFAVLDDVLMSVDAGHRREVCKVLKERFPDTQFVLTTHDPIWLRHMQTAGLVERGACAHFRTWTVDEGPTEWDDRDIWEEIETTLKRDDIGSAASLLRQYLEYVAAEICHALRAPVEFRGDAKYELGDLLPSAIGRLKDLLKTGKSAAQSWGQKTQFEAIVAAEGAFTEAIKASNVEQWQINSAIHFNAWANFQKEDFSPVVQAYRELVGHFTCKETACHGLIYLVLAQGARDSIKCSCGTTNVNLKSKPK